MTKNTFKAALISLTISTTGCATLFTGTTQNVTIDSYPQGAQVIINGKEEGTTPASIKIDKDIMDIIEYGKEIELEYDGYESSTHHIKAELNPVAILNLLNPLFWGIDAATGAITRYEDYNKFELKPAEEKPNINIKDKTREDKYAQLERLKKLQEQGVITQEEFEHEKTKLLAD